MINAWSDLYFNNRHFSVYQTNVHWFQKVSRTYSVQSEGFLSKISFSLSEGGLRSAAICSRVKSQSGDGFPTECFSWDVKRGAAEGGRGCFLVSCLPPTSCPALLLNAAVSSEEVPAHPVVPLHKSHQRCII